METRAALRLGCAIVATLMPLVCLTRAAAMATIPGPTPTLAAYVLCALAAGVALLARGGILPALAVAAVATVGVAAAAATGDALMTGVPLSTVPLAMAAFALEPGRAGASRGKPDISP